MLILAVYIVVLCTKKDELFSTKTRKMTSTADDAGVLCYIYPGYIVGRVMKKLLLMLLELESIIQLYNHPTI
jgi:hypothetical protein